MAVLGRLLSFAALTAAAGATPAMAAVYTVVATDDVEIDVEAPDTNFNSSGMAFEVETANDQEIRLSLIPATSEGRAEYLIFGWNSFGVGPGEVASGAGTFTWHVFNTLNISGNTNNFGDYTIHEITVGASWNESSVTLNSLLAAAGASDIAGIIGEALDAGQAGVSGSGEITEVKNSLTIPEEVVQRLLDGTSAGLLIQGVGPTNFQGRSHTWTGVANQQPRLTFETTVIPEPATLALLGLGAVAMVGRRR